MSTTLKTLLNRADRYNRQLPAFPQDWIDLSIPLAARIDHTILKPETTPVQVEQVCQEALTYHFASVCINPIYVPLVARLLAGSGVKTCSVVGFPLGATMTAAKKAEAKICLDNGAEEIDMVIPIGVLRSGGYAEVLQDIREVVRISHRNHAIVKVILEMAYLNQTEKIIGCLLCKAAGADFVKTSTGFAASGATAADVELMRRVVGPEMGVKAAGGIRTLSDARELLKVGATRLGASASVAIMQALQAEG